MQTGGVGGAAGFGAEERARSGSQSPISGVKRHLASEVGAPSSKKRVVTWPPLDPGTKDRMSLDFLCEQPKIELSSDQLTHLKKLFKCFDGKTISSIGTLREKVSDDGKNTGYVFSCTSDDQSNKLRFIVGHLEQWKTNGFKSTEDRVIFISNALEFEPKPEIEEEAIKYFSECIPQIIEGYNKALPNFGETSAKEQYKTFFSHVATIFQQPNMINMILNQKSFSNCSEQTIRTMATLFFSDLDEINLENATLSNDQLKALISGINKSKEGDENAVPIQKIILGLNVTCDNDAVLELAKISKDLTHIHLGHRVTCDNETLKVLAEKAEDLNYIHLGPHVTCDNDALLELATKATNINQIFLGNNVTCDNEPLKAFAQNAKDLKQIILGDNVTCDNEALLELAKKTKDLNKIFLGNGVTCDNEVLLKLATNAKNINQIFLGHRVTCDNEALLELAKKTKDLNKIFLGNRVTCDNDAILKLAEKAEDLNYIHLGPHVTCDNDAILKLAEKAKNLHCIALGNNVTCDNEVLLKLATNAKNINQIFLGHRVTCDNEALLELAKKTKDLNKIFLGNGVKCNWKTLKTLEDLGLDVQKIEIKR